MQPNEMNDTISIYSGDPANESPEQQIAKAKQQRAIQARLPKFELAEGERFYVPREKIVELNQIYFEMLDDMSAGFKLANQNMRSFMESVVFESYKNEIESLQCEHSIEGKHKDEVYLYTKFYLQPEDEKRWIFGKKKPNYVKQLLLRMANIEAQRRLGKYRSDIAEQEEFIYGAPEEPEELKELFNLIVDEISPLRKKRFIKKHGENLMNLIEMLMQRPQEEPKPKEVQPPLKEEPTELESSDAEPEQPNEPEPEPEDGSELDELYELEEQDEPEAETAEGTKTEPDGEQSEMLAIEAPVQQWVPMEASEGAESEPEQEEGETKNS